MRFGEIAEEGKGDWRGGGRVHFSEHLEVGVECHFDGG